MTNEIDVSGPEVQEAWNEFQQTADPYEREFLLIRLAELTADTHDFSDTDIAEDVQCLFERLRRAREDYHIAAVRVGRFIARVLEAQEVKDSMERHAGPAN